MRSNGIRLWQIGIAAAVFGVVLGTLQAADPPAKEPAVGAAEKPKTKCTLWAATGDFVSKSEDGGETWVHCGGKININANAIAVQSGVVWNGTSMGVNKSLDGGTTWVHYNCDNGLPIGSWGGT
jgi:hypothetical protein